jgi:hypothetical protein
MAVCQNDPAQLSMVVANFRFLIQSMRSYERRPSHFNAQYTCQANEPDVDVSLALNNIFGRKLKLEQIAALGRELARKLGLQLPRDTSRKKDLMLKWFRADWAYYESKIAEFGPNNLLLASS